MGGAVSSFSLFDGAPSSVGGGALGSTFPAGGWRLEGIPSGGRFAHLPAVVVDFVVASAAKEAQIVEVGGASVLPVDYVMGLAPSGFGSTSYACLIPGYESGTLRGGGLAPRFPQVQGL